MGRVCLLPSFPQPRLPADFSLSSTSSQPNHSSRTHTASSTSAFPLAIPVRPWLVPLEAEGSVLPLTLFARSLQWSLLVPTRESISTSLSYLRSRSMLTSFSSRLARNTDRTLSSTPTSLSLRNDHSRPFSNLPYNPLVRPPLSLIGHGLTLSLPHLALLFSDTLRHGRPFLNLVCSFARTGDVCFDELDMKGTKRCAREVLRELKGSKEGRGQAREGKREEGRQKGCREEPTESVQGK